VIAIAAWYYFSSQKLIKLLEEESKEEVERASAYELAMMVVCNREAVDRIDSDAYDLAMSIHVSTDYNAIEEATSRYRIFKLTY
jgi:hypothetical protein